MNTSQYWVKKGVSKSFPGIQMQTIADDYNKNGLLDVDNADWYVAVVVDNKLQWILAYVEVCTGLEY